MTASHLDKTEKKFALAFYEYNTKEKLNASVRLKQNIFRLSECFQDYNVSHQLFSGQVTQVF